MNLFTLHALLTVMHHLVWPVLQGFDVTLYHSFVQTVAHCKFWLSWPSDTCSFHSIYSVLFIYIFPFCVGSLPADDVVRWNRFWCFIMKRLILIINLTLFLIARKKEAYKSLCKNRSRQCNECKNTRQWKTRHRKK